MGFGHTTSMQKINNVGSSNQAEKFTKQNKNQLINPRFFINFGPVTTLHWYCVTNVLLLNAINPYTFTFFCLAFKKINIFSPPLWQTLLHHSPSVKIKQIYKQKYTVIEEYVLTELPAIKNKYQEIFGFSFVLFMAQ